MMAMGSIASITKKLGIGTISTFSSMAGIGKLIVGSLGDIQAVSASAGTLAGLVLFLNSLPMWFVVGSFALSTGYLIWSAVQGDLTISRAITEARAANERGIAEVKKANTRAWEFEPEFRDAMVNIKADRDAFAKAVDDIGQTQSYYESSIATAVDAVAARFHSRAEQIVREHFMINVSERTHLETKRINYQDQQIQMIQGRLQWIIERLDAPPQPLQDTE